MAAVLGRSWASSPDFLWNTEGAATLVLKQQEYSFAHSPEISGRGTLAVSEMIGCKWKL